MVPKSEILDDDSGLRTATRGSGVCSAVGKFKVEDPALAGLTSWSLGKLGSRPALLLVSLALSLMRCSHSKNFTPEKLRLYGC